MRYAQGRTYYDADSHIMELPDFLAEHADPQMSAHLPPINVPRAGKLANLLDAAAAERFTASLANASESARTRFYCENFADLFSLGH